MKNERATIYTDDGSHVGPLFMQNILKMTTEQAIKHLCQVLKEDAGYREGWKSNIAMAFYDEWDKQAETWGKLIKGPQILGIANDAADNFLNLLCKDKDEK